MSNARMAQCILCINTPTPPPHWALLERALIHNQALAFREFYNHYFDECGYLKCIPRWGALKQNWIEKGSFVIPSSRKGLAKASSRQQFVTPSWKIQYYRFQITFALDGPDDAIENLANWPIVYLLGGNDSILDMCKQAQDGYIRQYILKRKRSM